MEAYSNISSSSSATSTYIPQYQTQQSYHEFSRSTFHESLHAVRKSPTKHSKKAPIAPLPPNLPRVYKVDPINFRDLVQKLTGAPPPAQQRLQSVAPPPVNVDSFNIINPSTSLGLALSPSSYSWSTLSTFGQN
ncbi:hypothetical protein ACFE04_023424 [Oxalis oulophora]